MGGWDEEVFYAQPAGGRSCAPQLGAAAATRGPARSLGAAPDAGRAALRAGARVTASTGRFAGRAPVRDPRPRDSLSERRPVHPPLGLRVGAAARARDRRRPGSATLERPRASDLAALLQRPRLPPEIEDYARARLDAARRRGPRRRAPRDERDAAPPRRARARACASARSASTRKPAWPTLQPEHRGRRRRLPHDRPHGELRDRARRAPRRRRAPQHQLHARARRATSACAASSRSSTARAALRRYRSDIQGYEDCRLFSSADAGTRRRPSATSTRSTAARSRCCASRAPTSPTVHAAARPAPRAPREELDAVRARRASCCCSTAAGRRSCCAATQPAASSSCGRRADAPGRRRRVPRRLAGRGGRRRRICSWSTRSTAAAPTLRYLHRFVLLDERLALAALSPPFTFTSDRVEFCAGMARRGDELVLSFGVSDAAAGLAVLRARARRSRCSSRPPGPSKC